MMTFLFGKGFDILIESGWDATHMLNDEQKHEWSLSEWIYPGGRRNKA